MAFNFLQWDQQKEIVAVFAGVYNEVGKFKRRVFCFKDGKKTFHSWGLTQLSVLLRDIPFGTKVKIVYLGEKKMPDKNYNFKDFSLEVIEPPEDTR